MIGDAVAYRGEKRSVEEGPENYDARVSLGVLYVCTLGNTHTRYQIHNITFFPLCLLFNHIHNHRPLTESVQIRQDTKLAMAFHPTTTILIPFLALLSLYAAQKSYIAITTLQQNEERTEKAAKHFDKAARDLYKTRVTQASGAAAVCIHTSLQNLPTIPLLMFGHMPLSTMRAPQVSLRVDCSAQIARFHNIFSAYKPIKSSCLPQANSSDFV